MKCVQILELFGGKSLFSALLGIKQADATTLF
ncbi:hypothetical protein BMAGN_1543 [Bifidobacterium magnum]|uniref:Uncharacterized protein n=1 Tax=Bifidobacterium magnum TaxID=1692 RepID=A0A087B9N3_9BIFI|nr:hypothetical protein BMAGN_1543 [Bifidobacterium magnum]